MANNDSIKFAMHKTAMDYMCGLANYLQNLLNGGKISYEELVYETDPLYVQALLGCGFCYEQNPERSATVIANKILDGVKKMPNRRSDYIEWLHKKRIVGGILERLYMEACGGANDLLFLTVDLIRKGVFPTDKAEENINSKTPVPFVTTDDMERLSNLISQGADKDKMDILYKEISEGFTNRLAITKNEVLLERKNAFKENALYAQKSCEELGIPSSVSVLSPYFRNVYLNPDQCAINNRDGQLYASLESTSLYGAIGNALIINSTPKEEGKTDLIVDGFSFESGIAKTCGKEDIHYLTSHDAFFVELLDGVSFPIAAVISSTYPEDDCKERIKKEIENKIVEDSGNYPTLHWVARKTEIGAIEYLLILDWEYLEKKDKTQTSTDSTYFTY